jgi:hypothetical protein
MAYKVCTIVTWLLVIVSGAYYTFNAPVHCRHHHCHTIWGQNDHRPTPFNLNSIVTSIYWVLTLILQGNYIRYLWSADTGYLNSSANVGSHFILVCHPQPYVMLQSLTRNRTISSFSDSSCCGFEAGFGLVKSSSSSTSSTSLLSTSATRRHHSSCTCQSSQHPMPGITLPFSGMVQQR